jgi:hypothetical protein
MVMDYRVRAPDKRIRMQIYPPHPPAVDDGGMGLDLEVLRGELLRAELAGEISEFHALNFQAILAMAEDSGHAGDYLEMAEAIASSPHEQAIVAEHRTTYDLLQGDPLTAARRCLSALEHVCQTEALWRNLLVTTSAG